MKFRLNTERKLKDYENTVKYFNKYNSVKIGQLVNILLGNKIELVRVELALYGKLDLEQLSEYEEPNENAYKLPDDIDQDTIFEFSVVFIKGMEPIPGPGDEYGERVFSTGFSIVPGVKKKLPNTGIIDYKDLKYQLLSEELEEPTNFVDAI